MGKFKAYYSGHTKNARKALIKLGLATENELAYMSDGDVEKRLNESGLIILEAGNDYIIIPKEFEDKIIRISRKVLKESER
ncbi:hypothetical protein [Caldibacillus debilis]|uniref:Uncharacterized protein n=1 Tax=Caldibacillus debilis GB1 TaxID=1339248 RepID=A0A420VIN1_9BACI|nr:hypothetical protein [Caldibacillus debilis]RKO63238.1 hypothetical protein Cdeb_00330 [Caldibacillus debilis GB1]